MAGKSGEFEIIERLFAPLASTMPGAFGLTDDAAILSVEAGQELVLTKDAMVAGVHFFEHEDPALIAKKLLRTNLSDLAAMGATPIGYLLATAWPDACDERWIRKFTAGLKEDQEKYDIGLLGGDTVKTAGPLTLSLTALGSIPAGKALRRNGAHVGDLIYVTGTLGDAALGLQSQLGNLADLDVEFRQFLEDRYCLPQPRLSVGKAIIGHASSCLDISDGLLADIGHICEQSGVGATIERGEIPLSPAANRVIGDHSDSWSSILGGGDDYELAFTISPINVPNFLAVIARIGVQVTRIGEITSGSVPQLVDERGQIIKVAQSGWTHF